MFGKSIRKIRVIGALLVFASLVIVPGAATAAAPSITSAEVFGNWRPDVPNPPANMGPDTLFANSRPYGLRYEHGMLFIRGKATGDLDANGHLLLWIDVEVSDVDGNKRTHSVTAQHVNDPDIGRAQGDFNAELDVTELGRHTATGTDPKSTDPADWGGSVLTVKLTPRTPAGVQGTPVSKAITKYAGTPNDLTAPSIDRATWPPAHWCHTAGEGAKDPFFGQHMGGSREGSCGTFAMDGFGAIPDATWVFCVNATPGFDYQRQIPSQMRDRYCRTNPEASIPAGHAKVSGVVQDQTVGSQGIASEIASIKIEVLQGSTVVMTKNVITRSGTTAGYSVAWNINWLAPNAYDGSDPYVFQVTACDAWNQCRVAKSHEITVYPY